MLLWFQLRRLSPLFRRLRLLCSPRTCRTPCASRLPDFILTEKDFYEIKIAGLLHDCGKVTTPVHVVDKATKLETIFDRISIIDTRFEVIKRDAEVAMLKAKLAALEKGDSQALRRLEQEFELRLGEIDADREFLRFCNVGREAMQPEDQERVKQISAKYRWRDVEGKPADFLSANELENLTIHNGTLTAAERQIINHHIEVTVQLLESLPWPKHLKNVPEYAGGHHERMDGKGYPRAPGRAA